MPPPGTGRGADVCPAGHVHPQGARASAAEPARTLLGETKGTRAVPYGDPIIGTDMIPAGQIAVIEIVPPGNAVKGVPRLDDIGFGCMGALAGTARGHRRNPGDQPDDSGYASHGLRFLRRAPR